MSLRVGVDIGGTFTDLFVYDEDTGEMRTAKVLSTPPNFVDGVFHAFEEARINLADVKQLLHGSTIVDNALIERKLAKVSLITTKGFRDLLYMGRLHRKELYDLQWDKPAQSKPLVKRRDIFVVDERIGPKGEIIKPLGDDARDVAREIRSRNYESIAVFFINSYANPAHEIIMGKILAEECPDIYVSLSTDLTPTIRELPRLSTAVINACILPIVDRYLKELVRRLREEGFRGELLIIQSNGGVMRSEVARRKPVYIATSGPAAGVVAATYMAELLGIRNIVSFDMGGTTVKACLVVNGKYPITTEYEFEWDLPIHVPMMDIVELGAGGGSIAWIDEGGMLRVGPKSSGAYPGPVCYMRGGTEPTVTDANLVLGRLNPEYFLGGEVKISKEAAEMAIKEKIAKPLGISVEEAAMGIIEIADVNMIQACRAVTMERGYDPRDFTLIAFGGAGPMHCASIAEELEISKIIVPLNPGVFSAFGMCTTDFHHDFTMSFIAQMDEVDLDGFNEAYRKLEERALSELHTEGISEKETQLFRFAKMKYIGEALGHGLEIPVPLGTITRNVIIDIRKEFEKLHQKRYGFFVPEEPILFIDLLVRGVGKIKKIRFREWKEGGEDASRALKGVRKVYFKEKGFMDTPIYDRLKLEPNNFISGPAIIEEQTSTTVIPSPAFNLTVDRFKNLIIAKC